MSTLEPTSNRYFALMLGISVVLHGGAAWYGWSSAATVPPKLLPFNKAAATVSLRRTTTAVPLEIPRFVPPPRPLPPKSKIISPVKRMASTAPLPKLEIEPLKLPPKAPPKMARLPIADRVPLDEIAPLKQPDPQAEQAEREQVESSASSGVASTPASSRYNPPPTVNPRHLRLVDDGLELALTIGADGRPSAYRILDSSGSGDADFEQAQFVLENWRFDPATRAGQAIESTINVRINIPRR